MSQRAGAQRKNHLAPATAAPQATALMRMPIGPEGTPDLGAVGAPPIVQEVAPTVAASADRAPESFDEQLAEAPSGQALDSSARQYLEPRFGHSFGGVRIHADGHADQMARAVDASAFTYGQDIFFRSGAYEPQSPTGRHLLAHEAAHTIQQAGTTREHATEKNGYAISAPSDTHEIAAEQAARNASTNAYVDTSSLRQTAPAPHTLQRAPPAPPGAPVAPAAPAAAPSGQSKRYAPPPITNQGKLPANAKVDKVITQPLYDAIMSAGWPQTTRNNQTWAGWTEIARISKPEYWLGRLIDSTQVPDQTKLPTDIGTWAGDIDYTVSIEPIVVRGGTFVRADGVKIGQQTRNLGLGATGQGQEQKSETAVGTDGAKTGDSSATAQTSEQSNSVMALRTSDLQETALFKFDIYWTVTIAMKITTKPLFNGLTLEMGRLAAWIIEKPFKAEVSTSAEVRIPVADCPPE